MNMEFVFLNEAKVIMGLIPKVYISKKVSYNTVIY